MKERGRRRKYAGRKKSAVLAAVTALLQRREPGIDKSDISGEAAVMLPLLFTGKEWSVLFEVRAQSLSWQPGDICFPGGKKEPGDAGPKQTALRETCEELNLPQDALEICGELDFLVTHLGPIIYPFVGVIKDEKAIRPNSSEVETVFTVPLRMLLSYEPLQATMELANRAGVDFPYELLPEHSGGWKRNKAYPVYFYQCQGHIIWGLTARILYVFLQRLRKELPAAFFDARE